jgi:histidinol phosphatase-like enzyme
MLVLCEMKARDIEIIIDWDHSLMVGDREEDRECAERAGIAFQWADDFFERNVDGSGVEGHAD